jgi:hypothetical protein
LVADSRVLKRGENEKTSLSGPLHHSRRPISHLLFIRSTVHVDNTAPSIRIYPKEDFSLWCHHLVAAAILGLEFLAEHRRPFWQVLNLAKEIKDLRLGCSQC